LDVLNFFLSLSKISFWLVFIPYACIFSLEIFIVIYFVKKGGLWRLVGVFTSLVLAGSCMFLGYLLAFVGYEEYQGVELYQVTYPTAGWIGMFIGGLGIVLGIFYSFKMTKQGAEVFTKTQPETAEIVNEKVKAIQEQEIPEYIICPKCGLENWKGYDKCQKCHARLVKEND
jgi:hypothetical protein